MTRPKSRHFTGLCFSSPSFNHLNGERNKVDDSLEKHDKSHAENLYGFRFPDPFDTLWEIHPIPPLSEVFSPPMGGGVVNNSHRQIHEQDGIDKGIARKHSKIIHSGTLLLLKMVDFTPL